MKLQITAGSAVLVAANTHASAPELAPLSVDGAFLVFDFGTESTVESAVEAIRTMDVYFSGAIADSDDPIVISVLSSLKSQVAGVERDVVREFAYKTRASAQSEATENFAGSQLHGEQHTAINDSSSSNDAVSTDEELNNGQALESQSEQPAGRRGRNRS